MARDFYWSERALSLLGVGLHSSAGTATEDVKLQAFEVVVAAVFAQLRPDYDWWVTPNRPDGGVDFIGRGVFLTSTELGIDAAITIGGQCKKREKVNDVVSELSGSFTRMAATLHPTFFVAAFSARLTTKRVAEAKTLLEGTYKRHCHILDRDQLESLIGANLTAAQPIIRRAFSQTEADYLLKYFKQRSGSRPSITIRATTPSIVLAGEPFRIQIQIHRGSIFESPLRLKWSPSIEHSAGTLVAPLGAETKDGVVLEFRSKSTDDPFFCEQDLEFLLYAVGSQQLGTVTVFSDDQQLACIKELPAIQVAENLRPPFYEIPYREPLNELERGLLQARSGKVSCVAVVGGGGAGKTRLCEEMCLEARRHGADVVVARQAHSLEFPRRILVNLLFGLTDKSSPNQNPVSQIEDILSGLEPRLATRARPGIEAMLGRMGKAGSFDDDQSVLSVLAVLIARRARTRPIILHLHDLHWCTFDVLEVIDRLIWQLDHLKPKNTSDTIAGGMQVFFILEGRMHEHRQETDTGWSTRMFERFIERLGCPIAQCRAFGPEESAVFAQRLFEQGYSAHRMLPKALLDLQQELIDIVHRVAGGNPLHMLEQVKLLQQHGILAQNPRTGTIYMVRPDFRHVPLPPNVFDTIEARWRYYWIHDHNLAVLLWSAALMEDNLPASLFRNLWSRLAPEITQPKIESTEFLQLSERNKEADHVSFRHENYFQTIRKIQLPEAERQAVVDAYSSWFNKLKKLSPALRYAQARIQLQASSPNLVRTGRLLRAAQKGALKLQDRTLTSRILATLLDNIVWPSYEHAPLPLRALNRACDDELTLCDILIRSGRPDIASERIDHILDVIQQRLRAHFAVVPELVDCIQQQRFSLLAMKAGILFHDRLPAAAVGITENAIQELNLWVNRRFNAINTEWRRVTMEILETHSAAVALAGDMNRGVVEARKAAEIAKELLHTSPDALNVIITYANILLCEAPEESEVLLENYRQSAKNLFIDAGTCLRLDLNLGMTRILLGYRREKIVAGSGKDLLESADEMLLGVFKQAHPLGRLADAAASALLIGLVRALWNRPDEIDWFSQSVALAARARQLEALWRAQINLAHGLYRIGQSPHDPAAAALDLMTFSLSSYAEPDRTPRFNLLALPMAHAVRYLLLAGDNKAEKALQQFPALRRMFKTIDPGELKEDRDGRTSHEWLQIGETDYVIF